MCEGLWEMLSVANECRTSRENSRILLGPELAKNRHFKPGEKFSESQEPQKTKGSSGSWFVAVRRGSSFGNPRKIPFVAKFPRSSPFVAIRRFGKSPSSSPFVAVCRRSSQKTTSKNWVQCFIFQISMCFWHF